MYNWKPDFNLKEKVKSNLSSATWVERLKPERLFEKWIFLHKKGYLTYEI